MNKMKFFCIFAMAIMAGCATLSVLSCSEDEFEDFEDDKVYTLSKRKKTRSQEAEGGVGTTSYGNVADGELLWHQQENTMLVFNILDETSLAGYTTYEFPLELRADVVYTLANNGSRNYGAVLEWRPGYPNLSIEITSVTSNTISYKATFTGANYNPAISNPTNADHVQEGIITHES